MMREAYCIPGWSWWRAYRDHKWRVVGWLPGFAGTRPHVHIRCRRCGAVVVAEVFD